MDPIFLLHFQKKRKKNPQRFLLERPSFFDFHFEGVVAASVHFDVGTAELEVESALVEVAGCIVQPCMKEGGFGFVEIDIVVEQRKKKCSAGKGLLNELEKWKDVANKFHKGARVKVLEYTFEY